MKKGLRFQFYFLLAIASTSCAYNVEDELYPPATCDTLNVTYSGTVLPILEQNCYKCHDNVNVQVSQILLEGYDNLIVKVIDGKLIKAINHLDGASPMPKDRSTKLEQCDISKIEKWVSIGYPDN
jgi:hypothetical protein